MFTPFLLHLPPQCILLLPSLVDINRGIWTGAPATLAKPVIMISALNYCCPLLSKHQSAKLPGAQDYVSFPQEPSDHHVKLRLRLYSWVFVLWHISQHTYSIKIQEKWIHYSSWGRSKKEKEQNYHYNYSCWHLQFVASHTHTCRDKHKEGI